VLARSRARISVARILCSSWSVSQGWGSLRRRSNRVRFFSCNVALLPCRGVPGLARRYSEAAEESVYDGACVKQIFQRAERCRCLCRERSLRLLRRGKVSPVRRDQRLTAVGQNQNEMQSTLAMRRPKNVEQPAFERMASTDNGDALKKVLMMGSVSWFPSTPSVMSG